MELKNEKKEVCPGCSLDSRKCPEGRCEAGGIARLTSEETCPAGWQDEECTLFI